MFSTPDSGLKCRIQTASGERGIVRLKTQSGDEPKPAPAESTSRVSPLIELDDTVEALWVGTEIVGHSQAVAIGLDRTAQRQPVGLAQ